MKNLWENDQFDNMIRERSIKISKPSKICKYCIKFQVKYCTEKIAFFWKTHFFDYLEGLIYGADSKYSLLNEEESKLPEHKDTHYTYANISK